ncbi:hypothetical protein [Streptomyces sp. NPDC058701]|uniref:hypothetical protein n=1 Tax=Streptomyces sp. NPDC058701 TaxID=3346608 RepID=UPI00365F6A3F
MLSSNGPAGGSVHTYTTANPTCGSDANTILVYVRDSNGAAADAGFNLAVV